MKLPKNAKDLMRTYILLTDDLYNQRHKTQSEHMAAERKLSELHRQLYPDYQYYMNLEKYKKDDEKSSKLDREVGAELKREFGRVVGDYTDKPDRGQPLVDVSKEAAELRKKLNFED